MAQQPQPQTGADERMSLEQAARYSPTLRYMMKNGAPLNRETWMSMNYLGQPPEPWTAEHEAEVPEPWQNSNGL